MKRILLALPILLLIAGCTNPVNQWQPRATGDLKQIKGLEDCSYTKVDTGSINLHVIRCPGSTVSTTTGGKGPVTTITVDGVEYVRKQ